MYILDTWDGDQDWMKSAQCHKHSPTMVYLRISFNNNKLMWRNALGSYNQNIYLFVLKMIMLLIMD